MTAESKVRIYKSVVRLGLRTHKWKTYWNKEISTNKRRDVKKPN